jgi:hypothetical protein
MNNIKIIYIFLIGLFIYLIINENFSKYKKNLENWRDLPFIGNKDTQTYTKTNTQNYSRQNLPIYYPISSPLEDTYFNYLNSISSPKLSFFRNILRNVEIHINQDLKPIIFNYAERPIDIKQSNAKQINILALTVINLINKLGGSMLNVEYISTQNEIHEETEQQSKINFDLKLKLNYSDSEQMGKIVQADIIYLQPEFIFERDYLLAEDQFFKLNQQNKFKSYLSKLIIIGAEHNGFLGGRNNIKKSYSKKN